MSQVFDDNVIEYQRNQMDVDDGCQALVRIQNYK